MVPRRQSAEPQSHRRRAGKPLIRPIENSTLPLYGPSGAPTYQDVNQGYLGDCYFLSSLGEIALKDPSAIESMITSNGNGTYGVRFMVDGQPDYVTVNSELPVMGAGYQWANGSTLEFANGNSDDWVALIEKAYAELNAQTNAPARHGAQQRLRFLRGHRGGLRFGAYPPDRPIGDRLCAEPAGLRRARSPRSCRASPRAGARAKKS